MDKNFTLFSNKYFALQDKKELKKNVSPEIPSDSCIQNILNFSKALKIEKSASDILIEIVLN